MILVGKVKQKKDNKEEKWVFFRKKVYFCNHKMNRHRLKRQIAARLLIAVFLPVLVLSSLHRHEVQEAAHSYCEACVQHVSHVEQMAVADFSIHDCILCQFISANYLVGLAVAILSLAYGSMVTLPDAVPGLPLVVEGVSQSRAPPRCF